MAVKIDMVDGEKLLYQSGRHWITLWPVLVYLPVLVVLGFYLLDTLAWWTGALAIFMALVLAGNQAVQYLTSVVAVTTHRVVIRTGWLNVKPKDYPLRKVESPQYDYPIVGRMLGYGHVYLRGIGGSPERIRFLVAPQAFRRALEQARHALYKAD